ncbi:MAG: carboxypeptidase regulatory-like domain-containing protein [Planctomycetes bacterium]|nr:carboxypeptidase regulatory-like domain-containing protein [Planctomycetota bacterium]
MVLSAEDARAGTSGELEVRLASSVGSELELVLRPLRALRGVVLSEERNPVVGALVLAKPKGRIIGGSTPIVREGVRTDSSGRFSITLDAVPCLLVVSATKDDGTVTSKDVHWPRDSEDTVSLVFEGQPELQVRGTVRNVAGGVCPGVQVVLSPQEPARGSRTVLSDVSGRFNFQLREPGGFDLAARGAGYLTLEPVHMEVTLSQQQVQVELLVTESATISGRVSKPTGEPWSGVQVGAFATSAEEAGAWLLEHRFQAVRVSEPTQTSADGRFEVRDLHPGFLYEVWCLPDPARPQCFVYEDGVAPGIKDLVFLVDEARIRGGVLRAQWSFADGQRRAADAGLLLYERTPGGEWSGSRRPQAEVHSGELRVEGLRIGQEYYAELQIVGAARVLHGPWTATNEPERAEFVCGEDGELEGTVHYSDGSPARHWLVDLAEEPPGPAPPFTLEPHGPDGTVRFIPVAAGRYRVTARSGARRIGPFEVQIVPRRKSVLDIDVGAR